MPYDVSGVDNPEEVAVALQHRTICRSAMMTLVHFGKRRMKTIKSIASRNGVAPRHGNTGKRKRLREDDPKLIAIREHFEILIKLAEDCPRATRIVQKIIDGFIQRSTRDNDGDDAVYLPFSMGVRPCYYRYLQEQGYSVKVHQDGTYTVKHAGAGGGEKPYVALSTYYNIWQRDYGFLKVNKPVEDICAYCYGLSHRSQFMGCLHSDTASTTNDEDADENNLLGMNSTIDDELFREDLPEPVAAGETMEEAEEGDGMEGEVNNGDGKEVEGEVNGDGMESEVGRLKWQQSRQRRKRERFSEMTLIRRRQS